MNVAFAFWSVRSDECGLCFHLILVLKDGTLTMKTQRASGARVFCEICAACLFFRFFSSATAVSHVCARASVRMIACVFLIASTVLTGWPMEISLHLNVVRERDMICGFGVSPGGVRGGG